MLNVTLQIDEDGRRINQLKYQIEDLRQRQRDKVIFGASVSSKYFYCDSAVFSDFSCNYLVVFFFREKNYLVVFLFKCLGCFFAANSVWRG
jgi:hypothetical protein